MEMETTTKTVDLRPATKIIVSYVGHHTLTPDQLPGLIASVQHDHVVCLECGFRGKTLRRHLGTRHGLQTAEYLRRWDLPSDHPLTSPAYSERRSTMAKELGLGRKRSRPRGRGRRAKA